MLQTTTDCSGPAAYRLRPDENMSNCTRSWVQVASTSYTQQLQLYLWIAANCSTQPKQAGGNRKKNSIMTLLNGDW